MPRVYFGGWVNTRKLESDQVNNQLSRLLGKMTGPDPDMDQMVVATGTKDMVKAAFDHVVQVVEADEKKLSQSSIGPGECDRDPMGYY